MAGTVRRRRLRRNSARQTAPTRRRRRRDERLRREERVIEVDGEGTAQVIEPEVEELPAPGAESDPDGPTVPASDNVKPHAYDDFIDTELRRFRRVRTAQARKGLNRQDRAKLDRRNEVMEAERRRILAIRDDERRSIEMMRWEIRNAGHLYMDSLRDAKLFAPELSEGPDKRVAKFDGALTWMSLMAVAAPLSQGISPASVLQMVVTWGVISRFSPDLHQDMWAKVKPAWDTLKDVALPSRKARRVTGEDKRRAGREKRMSGRVSEGLREKMSYGIAADDRLCADTEFALEQQQRRVGQENNTFRDMFTVRTAAMTEIAITENAFWALQEAEPGERAGIQTGYEALVRRLRKQMAEDGLDYRDVVKASRTLIGQRMEWEPDLRCVFRETAFGEVVRAEPRRETGPDGSVREVWDGQMRTTTGIMLDDDMPLHLRAPMDAGEHSAHIEAIIKQSFEHCMKYTRDPEDFRATLLGYAVGWQLREGDADLAGLSMRMRGRLIEAETMISSMRIDGLDDEAQKLAYSRAYRNVMVQMQKVPEFNQAARHVIGHDWFEQLSAAMNDPHTFLASQRAATWNGQARSPEQGMSGFDDQAFSTGYRRTEPEAGTDSGAAQEAAGPDGPVSEGPVLDGPDFSGPAFGSGTGGPGFSGPATPGTYGPSFM